MIDSVLKGTGNSRFLKSAVPAGTSWADALAMLQAGTFPIDFNGINTEGFQQVGTPLNKANLLKDATAAQIGLPPSTTPDGMFQALGNTGELHVWRKTVTTAQEIPAGYTLGDAESGTAFSIPNAGSQNYVTLQYGPSITVNDAGGVSLTSVTGSVQFQQYSDVSAIYDIRNNFVKAIPNGGSTSAFDGVIFVPNDCSFKNTAGIVTFGKFYRVNAYPLTPAGTTTTYPVSTNPKAYQEGDDAKAAGYVVGEETETWINSVKKDTDTAYGTLASSVTVSDTGKVLLVSPNVNQQLSTETSSNFADVAQDRLRGTYLLRSDGSVWYVPTDAVVLVSYYGISKYGAPYDVCFYTKMQPVTGYAAIPAGTTIEYLGKLGDKARVQVVSYVGTGTYTGSNPTSITFDFRPKVVLFLGYRKSSASDFFAELRSSRAMVSALLTTSFISGTGFVSDYNANYSYYGKKSADGKTFYWYSTNNAAAQLNYSGWTYYFLAIG